MCSHFILPIFPCLSFRHFLDFCFFLIFASLPFSYCALLFSAPFCFLGVSVYKWRDEQWQMSKPVLISLGLSVAFLLAGFIVLACILRESWYFGVGGIVLVLLVVYAAVLLFFWKQNRYYLSPVSAQFIPLLLFFHSSFFHPSIHSATRHQTVRLCCITDPFSADRNLPSHSAFLSSNNIFLMPPDSFLCRISVQSRSSNHNSI